MNRGILEGFVGFLFWLLPMILILLGFGAIMVFAAGSAVAPFIYSLF